MTPGKNSIVASIRLRSLIRLLLPRLAALVKNNSHLWARLSSRPKSAFGSPAFLSAALRRIKPELNLDVSDGISQLA